MPGLLLLLVVVVVVVVVVVAAAAAAAAVLGAATAAIAAAAAALLEARESPLAAMPTDRQGNAQLDLAGPYLIQVCPRPERQPRGRTR